MRAMRTYSYGAKAPVENAEGVQRQLLLAARYRDGLVAIELARREDVWVGIDKTVAKVAAAAARKVLYGDAGGLHWGTRGAVTDACDRAFADVRDFRAAREGACSCKTEIDGVRVHSPIHVGDRVWWGKGAHRLTGCPQCGSPLRFRSFDGTGSLAVQLQGDTDPLEPGGAVRKGCAVRELLEEGHGQFRLTGTGRHRVVHIRIGSEGTAPIWASFPVAYHRDLPLGAVVKAARVCCRRVATHVKWTVQLMLDDVPSTLTPPVRESAGIDVGWRLFPDRMRVAMWHDSEGRSGELAVPRRLLDRWQKCEDLRSIQAKNLLAALDERYEPRYANAIEHNSWPPWLVEATRHAHQWRSRSRLEALVRRMRSEGFTTGGLYTRLEAWRKQDKHLWEWEANQRENVLRARQMLYRVFAAKLVALYSEVRVEDLDLRVFAELPDGPDDPITANARPRRFKACLSELLGAMRDAVLRAGGTWVLVNPAQTTKTCADCGHLEEFDAAAEVMHTCSSCGVRWDQDANAAVNILRAPVGSIVSTECSRDEKTKKSERAQRRAEGLARARSAKRAGAA